MRGHNSSVRDVAFSASGRHLASAGLDGEVRIWFTTTGSHVSINRYSIAASLHPALKMIGKGFVHFKINSSPTAFYIIKPTCISWLVFKVNKCLKKLSKTANPKVCFRCRVMTSSKWQNPNIQLVCAESAVKFNIWDVVSVVLSLIIMSSDEIYSLGFFTVGFKPLQSYIMSVWQCP